MLIICLITQMQSLNKGENKMNNLCLILAPKFTFGCCIYNKNEKTYTYVSYDSLEQAVVDAVEQDSTIKQIYVQGNVSFARPIVKSIMDKLSEDIEFIEIM